jgi:hypothetical protein
MIPQTFEQWKECIQKDCGITLTKKFASERLAVYEDAESSDTKKFITLYGKQHLQNIIQWLRLIQ